MIAIKKFNKRHVSFSVLFKKHIWDEQVNCNVELYSNFIVYSITCITMCAIRNVNISAQ
jgi:hypothetical protein